MKRRRRVLAYNKGGEFFLAQRESIHRFQFKTASFVQSNQKIAGTTMQLSVNFSNALSPSCIA